MSKKNTTKVSQETTPKEPQVITGFDNIEFIDDPHGQIQTVKFNLRNPTKGNPTYLVSMANALRRTIIADLPNYLASRELTQFNIANSVLNHDVLTQRLHLCPIRLENLIKHDNPTGIMIRGNLTNETKQIRSVYLHELQVEGYEDPAEFWTHPEILWTRLQPGQQIEFSTLLEFGTSHRNDSGFQPCSAVRYTFATSDAAMDKIIEKKTFKTEEDKERFRVGHREQGVHRLQDGTPYEYQFQLESLGVYPPQEVVPSACLILEGRYAQIQVILDRVANHVKNGEMKQGVIKIEDVITVQKYKGELEAFDFVIYYENDTLGNQWTQQIRTDDTVKFIGYRIPHPQDPLVVIRIALNEHSEDYNEYMLECIEKLKEHAAKLEKFWVDIRKMWHQRCPLPEMKDWEDWVQSRIFEIVHH